MPQLLIASNEKRAMDESQELNSEMPSLTSTRSLRSSMKRKSIDEMVIRFNRQIVFFLLGFAIEQAVPRKRVVRTRQSIEQEIRNRRQQSQDT